MWKMNTNLTRSCFVGMTAFATATLNGCGNQLLKESETQTVINIDTLLGNTSTDETASIEDVQERTEESAETKEQNKSWRKQYEAILKDWTLIEDYYDMSYLPMYFGEDYAFDSYWLCDVDQNDFPELFLHSSTMGCITAAFTCMDGQLVSLGYDDYYGINLETGEIVVHGHWHGAGGSYENEWTAYKVLSDKLEYVMNIDYFDLSESGEEDCYSYIIYNPETGEYVHLSDGAEEYEELYAEHVAPCITVNNYTLYDITDLSGLDRIQ